MTRCVLSLTNRFSVYRLEFRPNDVLCPKLEKQVLLGERGGERGREGGGERERVREREREREGEGGRGRERERGRGRERMCVCVREHMIQIVML